MKNIKDKPERKKVDHPVWTCEIVRHPPSGRITVSYDCCTDAELDLNSFEDMGPMIRIHNGCYVDPEKCCKTKIEAMNAAMRKLVDYNAAIQDAILELEAEITMERLL